MKRLVIFGMLVMFVSTAFSQAPDTIWSRLYGDRPSWDGYDMLYGAAETYDGCFVMNGYSTTAGDTIKGDQWVVKINADGDTLWTRPFGNFDRRDYGRDIIETYDNCLAILGFGRVASTTEEYRIRLFKADSLGNTIWDKHYYNSNSLNAEGIVETSDHGFAVAGYTSSQDAFLFRADSLGDSLWLKFYGGNDVDQAYGVCQTDDGGFILAGYTSTYGAGSYDAFIIRTDANGDTLWTRAIGTESYEMIYSICESHDGNYIVAGGQTNTNDDIYLIKIQDNGDTLWTKSVGQASANDVAFNITPTTDGCYLIAGRYYNVDHYHNDMYIQKVDADGNMLWNYVHVNDIHDEANDAIQTADGSCYLFGTRAASSSGAYRDYWVVKFDVLLDVDNGILNTIPDGYTVSSNYPNPFNPSTTIEYTLPQRTTVKLDVFNVLGQKIQTLVNTEQPAGTYQVLWDGTDTDGRRVATGMYLYRLKTDEFIMSKKMMMLK